MNLVFSIEGSYILTFREVCNFLGSVSSQQKFEATDGPVLQPHVISSDEPVLQLNVTAQFYLERKGKYNLEQIQKMQREEKPQLNFGSSFCIFFFLPLSLLYVIWASQEGCLFYLRFSLRSWDLPLFYFPGLSPFCLLARASLNSFFLILTT